MKKVINQSKKVIDKMPMLDNMIKEVDSYTNSFKGLQRQNHSFTIEIAKLDKKNKELDKENKDLKSFIKDILNILKTVFKKILHIGTEKDKDYVVDESINIYDKKYYKKKDMIEIAEDTTRENEIFEYIDYSKNKNNYYYNGYEDDFDYSKSEDKGMEI